MSKPNLLQRLRKRKEERASLVAGVVWYTSEDWLLIKASATDPELFEATYEEWCIMAENGLAEMRKSVSNIVKVLVRAHELSAWCAAHGRPNNSEARAEFASEKLHVQSNAGA